MIKWIKSDFNMVREALNYKLGVNVPFGIFLLYYVIVGALTLPLIPLVLMYYKIKFWRIRKSYEN